MSDRKPQPADRALDSMEADTRLIIDNAGPDTKYEHGRQLVFEGTYTLKRQDS